MTPFKHGENMHYGIAGDVPNISELKSRLHSIVNRAGDFDFHIDVQDEQEYQDMYDYDLILAVKYTLS